MNQVCFLAISTHVSHYHLRLSLLQTHPVILHPLLSCLPDVPQPWKPKPILDTWFCFRGVYPVGCQGLIAFFWMSLPRCLPSVMQSSYAWSFAVAWELIFLPLLSARWISWKHRFPAPHPFCKPFTMVNSLKSTICRLSLRTSQFWPMWVHTSSQRCTQNMPRACLPHTHACASFLTPEGLLTLLSCL